MVYDAVQRVAIEQSIRERNPLPDFVKNAPELAPGLDLYYTAFWNLTSCRPIGMSGAGPIPWTAIDAYAERYQFHESQHEELVMYIQAMDRVYLEYQADKSKKTKDTKPPPRKPLTPGSRRR